MNTPEFQNPGAGRRRARYSNEFKRQVSAACRGPGVSTAAVALANGLNANLLELSSAGQFDGQGDHHTPPAYVEKAFRQYLE
ncbi:hypothetical protein BLL52_2471 [Rhodoferax antarcticus ANT.BR]|uniref:Transposase n=1 Tax=Rhodoferax antarcticus ANT.BR TaxID=1111071 RepID=A0A1Q8YEE8_9BURK|nr:hypothetical protein BLL52_2471 [Rhodoferax antarcticus ANT.BR]